MCTSVETQVLFYKEITQVFNYFFCSLVVMEKGTNFLNRLLFNKSVYLDQFKLELVALSVLVVFLVYRYFDYSQFTNALAVAIVVGCVLYLRSDIYFTKHRDNNQLLDHKLNKLQSQMYMYVEERMTRIRLSDNRKQLTKQIYKQSLNRVRLTHMYTDSKLVHFCHSLIFLYRYNEDSFASLMLAVNGVLRIRTELEHYYDVNGELPPSVSYDVQTAEELHKKAVNFAHTFIYSVPKTNNLEYTIEDVLDTLYRLLKPHVVAIKRMAIKRDVKIGVHRRTHFTELNSGLSKPVDSFIAKVANPRYNKKLNSNEYYNRFELYI